ncbi:odorant receptor 49a-like isoform X3 [Harpegnathos saltator]|uniref:odorant receptor 49a-like isoform X3 n=1 Tax=Harpegnathos saltator TaxID=610380 RepID=UPI000DBEF262|nr:odorant receptor 49a-like isoform X3 [Harpegnathos saltator]XP_025160112.1 odorant receptor 49a-like isoform X3 [Harpegnathos saltator]
MGVTSLTINLFHTLQAILGLTDMNDLILPVFYVIMHFIYIFVMNYGGQLITDHSADILKTLYEVQWYVAPIHVQKLILFLMLKNTKSYGLIIGGIYVASLEGFVTLTSMSISYFMVIYSTQ